MTLNPTTMRKTDWNPWPYGLAAFLGLFASAVVAFGIFAIRHPQDLVGTDYYEQEIRFQQRMDQVARAQALEHTVRADLAQDGKTLHLTLPSQSTGKIQFYRPSNAGFDREEALGLDPAGKQSVDVSRLQSGPWRARVLWQSGGQDFFREFPLVIPKH